MEVKTNFRFSLVAVSAVVIMSTMSSSVEGAAPCRHTGIDAWKCKFGVARAQPKFKTDLIQHVFGDIEAKRLSCEGEPSARCKTMLSDKEQKFTGEKKCQDILKGMECPAISGSDGTDLTKYICSGLGDGEERKEKDMLHVDCIETEVVSNEISKYFIGNQNATIKRVVTYSTGTPGKMFYRIILEANELQKKTYYSIQATTESTGPCTFDNKEVKYAVWNRWNRWESTKLEPTELKAEYVDSVLYTLFLELQNQHKYMADKA